MDEEKLLASTIEELCNALDILKKRKTLIQQMDTSFGVIKQIRQNNYNVLGDLHELKGNNKNWTAECYDKLNIVETTMQLERIPFPVFDSTEDNLKTSKILRSTKDSLISITKNLSENLKQTEEKATTQKNQDKSFEKALHQYSSWIEAKYDTKNQIYQELNENLKVLINNQKLNYFRFIPNVSKIGDDPFENSDELLDRLIISRDFNIIYPFLLTYRYFFSPVDLFTRLCGRFCFTPCEYHKKVSLISNQQDCVIEFLKIWIENFPHDFFDAKISSKINTFLDEIVIPASKLINA